MEQRSDFVHHANGGPMVAMVAAVHQMRKQITSPIREMDGD
jgi:hypothetical protein